MKKSEWNKFFTWLIALFPQWKPDAAVSAAWLEQLQNYEPLEIKTAIRHLRTQEPSPFPPGVFEIIAVLETEASNPELDGSRAWETARLCARGSLSMARAAEIDPRIPEAIRLVGGVDAIGMCHEDKRPFLKRDFLEVYKNLRAENLGQRVIALERYTGPEKIGSILPKLAKKVGSDEG